MHVKCIVNENKESHQRLTGIRSLDIDLLAIWKSETKADTHLNFACPSHLMLSLRLYVLLWYFELLWDWSFCSRLYKYGYDVTVMFTLGQWLSKSCRRVLTALERMYSQVVKQLVFLRDTSTCLVKNNFTTNSMFWQLRTFWEPCKTAINKSESILQFHMWP